MNDSSVSHNSHHYIIGKRLKKNDTMKIREIQQKISQKNPYLDENTKIGNIYTPFVYLGYFDESIEDKLKNMILPEFFAIAEKITPLNWSISINNIENTLFKSVSIDGVVGMVAALNTENSTCTIYYTINGGTSWNTSVLSITEVSDIVQIIVSGTIGYVALKNLLYKTNDSGANWEFNSNLGIVNINDISLSSNNAILGTSSGIYYNICASSFCYTYENQRFTFIYLNYKN